MSDQQEDETAQPVTALDQSLDAAEEQVDQIGSNIADTGGEVADAFKDALLAALEPSPVTTPTIPPPPDIRPAEVDLQPHSDLVKVIETSPAAPPAANATNLQAQLEQAKAQEAQLGKSV